MKPREAKTITLIHSRHDPFAVMKSSLVRVCLTTETTNNIITIIVDDQNIIIVVDYYLYVDALVTLMNTTYVLDAQLSLLFITYVI